MNKRFACALALIIPLLMGVGPAADSPRPAIPGNPPKGSIAVLCGTTTEISKQAARFITQALTAKSLLSVAPQEKIAQVVPKYPDSPIRGPYTANYVDGYRENYSRTDSAKIKAIQEQLGVDYLYVLWIPATQNTASGIITHQFIAQLFQAPQSTDIDHSTFESQSMGKRELVFFPSCMTIVGLKYNNPTKEEELEELKRDAGKAADHILSVLSAAK